MEIHFISSPAPHPATHIPNDHTLPKEVDCQYLHVSRVFLMTRLDISVCNITCDPLDGPAGILNPDIALFDFCFLMILYDMNARGIEQH